VVVREVEALASSSRARELLTGLAAAPPPGLAAVLTASIPKGSGARFWKDLKKQARSFEVSPLSQDDVPGWLLQHASATLGTEIEDDAAVALASAIGSDLGVIARELEKLSAFVRAGAPITRADVEAAGIQLPAQDKWQWLDMVGERRFGEALEKLPVLLSQGETPVGLAIALGGHLLRIGVAVSGGPSALQTLLPPNQRWLARRVGPQARGWSTAEVTLALERLLRADRLMKASGIRSEAVLEEWLLGLMAQARAAA